MLGFLLSTQPTKLYNDVVTQGIDWLILGIVIMLDQMMKMMVGHQIGSYRLNKFLGAGSFGCVFHASEMVRNTSVQEVAVKVIPESSDDKLIELQAARKLEHSNLIKAYSVGEFSFMNTEMLYLVMELAQGSLENHIQKGDLSSNEIKILLLKWQKV